MTVMQNKVRIDFGKLLGFKAVADEISSGVDFQNDTIGAKLGAKVGGTEALDPTRSELDCSKLLGFETVASDLSGALEFQNETIGDKLGAKIGLEPEFDARLKRDISQIATRSDGLPVYAFKYLWDDQVYVGVMAQDLLRNARWRPAVTTKPSGYFAVNYAKLGLRMATLDGWKAEGMASLIQQGEDDNRP